MTSYLPSILNDFNDVATLIHSCISSKKIIVFSDSKINSGLIKDIFLIIVSISNQLSKIDLYCFCKTKFISTKYL